MLRMKMTGNTSSSWDSTILNDVGRQDPVCLFALSASSLEYEVLLCLVLVECWQGHLLMTHSQVVDTVVLSWRANFHNDFAGHEMHHNWCQYWRCSRGTWDTLQSNRAPIEKLGRSRRSAIGPEKEVKLRLLFVATLRASMALAWSVCHGLCPLFFISKRFLWLSMEFSTLQKLFWFVPSYFNWVEARRRIHTFSNLLVRASSKKNIE